MVLTVTPASVYTDAGGDRMPRKYYNPEVAARAQAKYDSTHTARIGLKLNKETDADILSWLEVKKQEKEKTATEGGMQGYIKSLIRQDMEKQKGNA